MLLLALGLMLTLAACNTGSTPNSETQTPATNDGDTLTVEACPTNPASASLSAITVEKSGHYNTKDELLKYLTLYSCLPENYITTEEAQEMGWTGGSVETVAPGYAIGGDVYEDPDGELPVGRKYYQCDVDTLGQDDRGSKRMIYAGDLSHIYYTEDNFETLQLLYRNT